MANDPYNPQVFNDLIGGKTLLDPDTGLPGVRGVFRGSSHDRPRGVHAESPGATPKYNTSIDGAVETMARMMIPLAGNINVRNRFINSLPKSAKGMGEALAVTGNPSGTPQGTGKGEGLGYIDFLLQNAQESYQEKVQVVDVLSDNYIAYFFGQEPPVFSYQGTLLNTYQDDWRAAFSIIYGEIIRGTKLARYRRLMTLTYDNVAVTGTAIRMSQNLTGDMEMASSFTLDILVKRYDIYRLSGTAEKGWTPPSAFTDVMGKLIDPNTFTGLKLGSVKRTYRTFGRPTIVESEPKKNQNKTTEQIEKGDPTIKETQEGKQAADIKPYRTLGEELDTRES